MPTASPEAPANPPRGVFLWWPAEDEAAGTAARRLPATIRLATRAASERMEKRGDGDVGMGIRSVVVSTGYVDIEHRPSIPAS
jgi:hypothetical protein